MKDQSYEAHSQGWPSHNPKNKAPPNYAKNLDKDPFKKQIRRPDRAAPKNKFTIKPRALMEPYCDKKQNFETEVKAMLDYCCKELLNDEQ